ncbi:MAG: radical SAM protein [Candidatus Omnitrophota bacterium]
MRPPIESAYLAAVLEKSGSVCYMRDYSAERKEWKDFEHDLILLKPDMLIINTTTPTIDNDMHAAFLAKRLEPDILTVGKGAHFLVLDGDVLEKYSELDVVIRGEGEITVAELAKGNDFKVIDGITYRDRKGQGIIRNRNRVFIENLDSLPFPARHLMNNKLYVRLDTGQQQTTIQAGRGCPYGCIFCLASKLSGKKVRLRSPDNICAEIELCLEQNIRNFFLRADTFTYNKDWVINVCKEIIKRNLKINWVCNSRADTIDEAMLDAMKESGCYAVTVGIESGNQESLDKMKKGITLDQITRGVRLYRKKKIFVDGYFLTGFPWDTEKTIRDSIDFAIKLDLDAADFHIAYPFPGTDLFELGLHHGLFERRKLAGTKPYAEAVMQLGAFTSQELEDWRRKMFRAFYLRPKYIIRIIIKFGHPGTFLNCLRVGLHIFLRIINPK